VWLDDAQRAVGVDQWGQRGRHGGLNLINGGNAHIDPIPTKGINHIIHSQTEVTVVIVGGCPRVSVVSIIRTVAARAGIILDTVFKEKILYNSPRSATLRRRLPVHN
jgi:hypothetical protein